MSTMSMKEQAVLATVGVVIMYALAVGLWFVSQQQAWKKARRQYDRACETYRSERKLIAEAEKWNEAYEEEKAQMRTFAVGKSTDTTWLPKMDELAQKHHITIAQRQAGKEVSAGDVLELPIEVRNWEGALESLVKFIHELENTDEGMFDVTTLNFKPSSKKGYLKGSFTLSCAYMREE